VHRTDPTGGFHFVTGSVFFAKNGRLLVTPGVYEFAP
jgi:hypothetical protein